MLEELVGYVVLGGNALSFAGGGDFIDKSVAFGGRSGVGGFVMLLAAVLRLGEGTDAEGDFLFVVVDGGDFDRYDVINRENFLGLANTVS